MSTTRIREISISDRAYQVLLLLAVSSSRSLPALLFTRTFAPTRIVSQGDLNFATFYKLFRVNESEDEANITPEQHALLPSTFGCDWQYGAHQLGPELETLRREKYLEVTYEEKITFLEISHNLRQEIWTEFARDLNTYRNVQIALCDLIIISLPVPYAAPLWEMTSFACKDVIASTLIPFLFTSPGAKSFQENRMTEDDSCLLIFHLTNLGFTLDDGRWEHLFDNSHSSNVISFFKIHKEISGLLNVPSSESLIDSWKAPQEFDLPQNSFGASLLGLTIAQIPWKFSNPIVWEYFEAWRSCWSNSYKSRQAILDEVAYAIIHPDSIQVSELPSRLPSGSLYALAIGLKRAGHLETSSRLLYLSLRARTNEWSSEVYGLLFTELLKSLTVLGKATEASILGTSYLKATHTSNAYISIATADAFIALGNYGEAHGILHHILSDTSLGSFEEICSVLRLNKVWRRKPDLIEQARFANNLARVVNAIGREDAHVQEDYITELQATVYHVRQSEELVPPELCQVIEDTLNLFKEDDVKLRKSRSTLRALLQTSSTAPSPHESSTITTNKRNINLGPNLGSNTRVISALPRLPITETDRLMINVEWAWEKRNLLSLDGGGTSGYWSLLVLMELMRRIRTTETDPMKIQQPLLRRGITVPYNSTFQSIYSVAYVNFQLCDYFDLICGTNTGGLIALMLGRYRLSIASCVFNYERIMMRTFGNPKPTSALRVGVSSHPKYKVGAMRDAIRDFIFETGQNDDIRTVPGTCAVLVPALSVTNEITTKGKNKGIKTDIQEFLVRSYYDHFKSDLPSNLPQLIPVNSGRTSGLKLEEVVQAITTGPVEMHRHSISGTDKQKSFVLSGCSIGDLSDPAGVAFEELQMLHGTNRIGVVVSVGAMHKPQPVVKSPYPWRSYGAPELAHKMNSELERYWRFNDEDVTDITVDEWKPSGIATRENNIGTATIKKIQDAFDIWSSHPVIMIMLQECADELVVRRRLRTFSRERWNRFVLKDPSTIYRGGGDSFEYPSGTSRENRGQSQSIL